MFRTMDHRAGHYLLLVALWGLGCLPNLGAPTLWDIDEGLNAEAAREMVQSGNYVVPTFNYKLRSAKPVLLYWLQAGSYHLLGVNETAARLPSALAALLAVLATYEFGRVMFGLRAALLSGIILATSVSVLGAAHFANPDALLLAFTTLTLGFYYLYYQTRRFWWLHAAAVACGLAVLAKGPVGILLPGAVVFLFLLWQRQLSRLIDLHLGEGVLIFLLVAVPWYAWVGVETKGQFLREFWFMHHLDRVDTALEKHSGSPFYYVVALAGGLFPWSIFLGPSLFHTWRRLRWGGDDVAAVRLLALWFVVCFGVFTYAETKLPNYILPLYPAAALLTAWALERWRAGEFAVPGWIHAVSLSILALVGVGTTAAALVYGGAVEGPRGLPFVFPDLARWAWVGALPLTGAVIGGWLLARGRREAFLAAVTASSAGFVFCVTGGALAALDDHKASRYLAASLPADHEYREIRVGAYCYDRPSMVFYCRREVRRLDKPEQAVNFLAEPLPTYVFVSESRWGELERDVPDGARVLARFPDLYGKGHRVLVVANRAAP
jgi:4-amino-4-deoxy-L-arabinose transferase-like glycosyltransferase